MYRYLFGPVPSRRLGYSLGVDLIPSKTCSFNCVFCQAGNTSDLTLERREYVPISDVIDEINAWIGSGASADYITLAGSGEPTLNSEFGRVIDAVHEKCRIRTALLSNGSLFRLAEVRTDASRSDLVKISLSAWDQPSFERINRSHPGLRFESVLQGLQDFGSDYKGELWLEVFVVSGLNDDEISMRRIGKLAKTIVPDCIHLNTVVRPPAESNARAVPFHVLQRFTGLFEPVAEVISSFSADVSACENGDAKSVVGLVSRHPCELKDIAVLFGNDLGKTEKVLDDMVVAGKIRVEKHNGHLFYTAVDISDEQMGGKPSNV
ncbi:MAG: radical SAM protein [Kiritimatiellae bacterium]|nr:radical SAM protein [Kiritimatiellia bacterium]MDD5521467.1 radical SAM protein [Kiritimatiellia bacterium]